MKILNSNANSITLSKLPPLALLTNVSSSAVSSWKVTNAVSSPNTETMEVLTCTKTLADGQGGIAARTSTGQPMILLPVSALAGSSLCQGCQGNSSFEFPPFSHSSTPTSSGSSYTLESNSVENMEFASLA